MAPVSGASVGETSERGETSESGRYVANRPFVLPLCAAYAQAIRCTKGERPARRRLQHRAVVDVARRSEALAHLGGLLGREERRPDAGSSPGRPVVALLPFCPWTEVRQCQ